MARILPGRSIGASKVAPRTGGTGRPAILRASGPFISSQRSMTPIKSVGASGRRSPSAMTASSIITPGLDGESFVAKRTSFMVFPLSNISALRGGRSTLGPTIDGFPPSRLSKIESKLGTPCVELGQLPCAGLHRKVLVPRTRLTHAQFRYEYVHLGVEFDQDAFGVVVIGSQIVARRMTRGSPESRGSGAAKLVTRGRMSRVIL